MNHKRGRSKNQRAGCLMCKPNKMNGARQRRGKGWLGNKGFGKLRDDYHSNEDLKDVL